MSAGSITESKACVLVVDDTQSNRYVFSAWLRRAGYNVLEAGTGNEALRLLTEKQPDLVMLDICLPDIDGYAVCERIKERSETREIPVLHVSSVATQASDRSKGLRRGAEGYLAEPIESEELLATVEALLRAASAQRTANRLALRLRQLNYASQALAEQLGLDNLVLEIVRQAGILFDGSAIFFLLFEDISRAAFFSILEKKCEYIAPHRIEEILRISGDQRSIAGSRLHPIVPFIAEESNYLCAKHVDIRGQRGILFIEATASEQFPEEETTVVLNQYMNGASSMLRNARSYDVERGIALTLQRSLLPDIPSSLPKLEVVTRYAASSKHAEVGGDFYEFFHVNAENIIIAIGDVVGHSLEAATIMAQLRTGIRCYALEGHDSKAILERLNSMLETFHPDFIATVCVALYNTENGLCEISNAGHPPPLLVRNGEASFLPRGGALLGVRSHFKSPHFFTLHPNDRLILYTDGLAERPGQSIDEALENVAHAIRTGPEDLSTLCDMLLSISPGLDDAAIIALRRRF